MKKTFPMTDQDDYLWTHQERYRTSQREPPASSPKERVGIIQGSKLPADPAEKEQMNARYNVHITGKMKSIQDMVSRM
jgi:hypothetical protein